MDAKEERIRIKEYYKEHPEAERHDRENWLQFLPTQIERLLDRKLIDKKRLSDTSYVLGVLEDHPAIFEELTTIPRIEHEFVEAAQDAIAAGRRMVAVVLIATAIEQKLNVFLRHALEAEKRLDSKEATEAIRALQLKDKLGWLFALLAHHRFRDDLKKQILELAELRNLIVHFKGTPVPLDSLDEEATPDNRVKQLDMTELLELVFWLEAHLIYALAQKRGKDPNYQAAIAFTERLRKRMHTKHKKSKKPPTKQSSSGAPA
jgi:predicted RNA-binding protein with RPS1 domain